MIDAPTRGPTERLPASSGVSSSSRPVRGGHITAGSAQRNRILAARDSGEAIQSDAKLRFGPVADDCLAGPIAALAKKTRAGHRNINKHLKPRWARPS